MYYNLGDKVILKLDSGYPDDKSNPKWNGLYGKTIGEIVNINVNDGCYFRYNVEWSNGIINVYKSEHLELYDNGINNLFEELLNGLN